MTIDIFVFIVVFQTESGPIGLVKCLNITFIIIYETFIVNGFIYMQLHIYNCNLKFISY